MASSFEVRHSYFPASSNSVSSGQGGLSGGRAGISGAHPHGNPTLLAEAGYRPTLAECATLAEPIAFFLSQCTCYDMLGMSTQVVVLDVDAALAVAFIAAQETRVQSCVLWDPRKHEFVGVLSSVDYMMILLYCQQHPEEAEAVSTWSIRHWQAVKKTLDNSLTSPTANSPTSGDTPHGKPQAAATSALATCRAETSLCECLGKMRDFNVRRVVALAEKEGEGFSVVAMIDVDQVVEYLGTMFFRIEKVGGSLLNAPGSPTSPSSSSAAVGGRLGGSSGVAAADLAAGGVPGSGGAAGSAVGPGGAGGRHRGAGGGDVDDEEGSGLFASGDAVLPPHVTSILCQAEAHQRAHSEPLVGPYRTIFDVPFMYLPQVGRHRRTPVYVTMEHKLNEALSLMLKHDIESIAVCTNDHIILDVISRSDLLRMEDQGVYDTNLTVREALASKISERVFVFYEKDTLRDIFAHFVRRRVKELFLVDPDTDKLLGQLNIAEFVLFVVFASV